MTRKQQQSSMHPPDRPAGKERDVSPGKRHSSAPSMGRKKEPMVTPEPKPAQGRPVPGRRRAPGTDTPPDEDT